MKFGFTLGVAAMCAVSFAQFSDNFESETGSVTGTLLTNGFGGGGQNGWYNPVSGSIDSNVYTYAGNALGFSSNPFGGNQFVGMNVATAQTPWRAQHSVNFSAGGTWTMTYDFNGNFNGTPPAADNLGSVSLQPSATNNIFQTIYQWTSPVDHSANADAFNANIGAASAAGGALTFASPGVAFQSLSLNHWYRESVTWNFTTNQIMSTSIRDLTTGGSTTTVDVSGNGWYLSGGQNNVLAQATATDIRLFGSGSAGDIMGYDNFSVAPVPEPASMAVLGLGALALLRRRRNR
jgi:hypothetical protein